MIDFNFVFFFKNCAINGTINYSRLSTFETPHFITQSYNTFTIGISLFLIHLIDEKSIILTGLIDLLINDKSLFSL